jgi:hypothetical protein
MPKHERGFWPHLMRKLRELVYRKSSAECSRIDRVGLEMAARSFGRKRERKRMRK